MRLSCMRLAEKFVANRKVFFGDRYDFHKSISRNFLAGCSTTVVCCMWIYEFAYPTPDLQHDLRMFGSYDYRQFVKSEGRTDDNQSMWDLRTRGFEVRSQEAKDDRLLHRTNVKSMMYRDD